MRAPRFSNRVPYGKIEHTFASWLDGKAMITYVETNLFTSPAQTLVNTVNTVGVMGKGVAKRFKIVYPDMFVEYKRLCDLDELTINRLLLYRTPHKWILNFPTKRHWRHPSHLGDIEAGLLTFHQTYAEQGVTSIAFPQLGCGNGGLDWETQVRPLMERHLASLPIDIFVHISSETSSGEESVDEELVNAWLLGDPPSFSFKRFRNDLAAGLAGGEAMGPSGSGTNGWPGAIIEPLLDSDSLFTLWRRLRSFGYLLPADVETLAAMPAKPVLDVLATLPYIGPTRIAAAPSPIGYDARSTRAMLEAPEAQGIRIVLPLVAARPVEPSPSAVEDDASCNASRMTSQLALFSTS
jgi:O-acetyl-ADP-ribose deacetylase (regulator of RNase III)